MGVHLHLMGIMVAIANRLRRGGISNLHMDQVVLQWVRSRGICGSMDNMGILPLRILGDTDRHHLQVACIHNEVDLEDRR